MAGNGRAGADSALITALASGKNITEAAAAAGVSARTAFRRMQSPDFRDQVTEARALLVDTALGLLAAANTEAAGTLRRLLRARSEMVAYLSAKTIIELTARMRETADLAERIAALEEADTRPSGRWGREAI